MVTVAVIGGGGWGKNHVRNFHQIESCRLKAICDLDEGILAQHQATYDGVETTTDATKIFGDEQVDAVVIAGGATPRSDGRDGLQLHFDQSGRATCEATGDEYVLEDGLCKEAG